MSIMAELRKQCKEICKLFDFPITGAIIDHRYSLSEKP
jgi:hypothetical protein